jgi:transcription elongation GreA/GreB family factor
MGVSLGKIKSDMGDIMLISPNSPIGILFMGKKIGDLVIHNNKEVRILGLV